LKKGLTDQCRQAAGEPRPISIPDDDDVQFFFQEHVVFLVVVSMRRLRITVPVASDSN
jgi:hypothetical protein